MFNPYIIEVDQPVKLRFLPLVLNKTDENSLPITLDLILKEGKIYVLIGFPDGTGFEASGRLREICSHLLKLLRIRFGGMNEQEGFQWYLLCSQYNGIQLLKLELSLEEGLMSSVLSRSMDISDSPFNLTGLNILKNKENPEQT